MVKKEKAKISEEKLGKVADGNQAFHYNTLRVVNSMTNLVSELIRFGDDHGIPTRIKDLEAPKN